jgi:periplasmic copper chaperone A
MKVKRMQTKAFSLGTMVVCGLIACATAAGAEAGGAVVTVLDPWVRGTVEGQTTTAAYMTLRAEGGARLVSVTSPAAGHCSVHEMTISGNLMKMRTLDTVTIPAGGTLALAEGHDHLMLEDLTHALKAGDTVPLTLTFVDASGKRRAVEVQAPVVPLGTAGPTASRQATAQSH